VRGLLLDHYVGERRLGTMSGSWRAWGLVWQVGEVLVPFTLGDRGCGLTDSSGDAVDVGFPQVRGAVGAGRGQGMSVRAEGHRSDAAGVAGQGAEWAGVVQVVEVP